MRIPQFRSWLQHQFISRMPKIQTPTVIILAITAVICGILAAWFAGEKTTVRVFSYLNFLQDNSPWWIQAPPLAWEYFLTLTGILFLIVLVVMKISPQPRPFSRKIIGVILLALLIRYVLWRSLSTLNLSTPLNGVFSLGLFILEMIVIVGIGIQTYLMMGFKDRYELANRLELAIINGTFTPSVDILIPTYNEPAFIIKRTIIGCQALAYTNKKIYVLDDTRRPEIKELTENLGCGYITRPDNNHAKAGNLNYAIARTNGDLIAVFDADFIPTKNFLSRTVGFFQDAQVGLIQTPQSFYNQTPIARNLGLENILVPEEENYYRYIQPMYDSAGTGMCAGTSFVVRRSSLEEIGGFVTDSVTEDYCTGILISAQGYQVIYFDEQLSAGLAPESMAAHIDQRLRWGQGRFQILFIDANPLTISGLNILQRLGHLESFIHYCTMICRTGFLLIPIVCLFLGIVPIKTTTEEILYYMLPYYLIFLATFAWINLRSVSLVFYDIYCLIQTLVRTLSMISVILSPFSKGFKVTPKGISRNSFTFNWSLAWPFIVIFIAITISLWQNLGIFTSTGSIGIAAANDGDIKILSGIWVWNAYQLLEIAIILLMLIDAPKSDSSEWFDLQRTVKIKKNSLLSISDPEHSNFQLSGVTKAISETGVKIVLTEAPTVELISITKKENGGLPVTLEMIEEKLELPGEMFWSDDKLPIVSIVFAPLSLSQYRCLIEILFCRPNQWKRSDTPGEFKSLLLLFKVLLTPKFFVQRNQKTTTLDAVLTEAVSVNS